jgi:hypothetical protein
VRVPAQRATACIAEGCDEPLPVTAGRGRPRLYCSPRCRATGKTVTGPLTVEVDHETDEEDGGRPTGRVWLVRMRRDRSEVIIATELGRPSADHLAAQIADLIGSRRKAGGGAME